MKESSKVISLFFEHVSLRILVGGPRSEASDTRCCRNAAQCIPPDSDFAMFHLWFCFNKRHVFVDRRAGKFVLSGTRVGGLSRKIPKQNEARDCFYGKVFGFILKLNIAHLTEFAYCRYIAEVRNDMGGSMDVTKVTSNPINAFHLLRRTTVTWNDVKSLLLSEANATGRSIFNGFHSQMNDSCTVTR